ncbi:DUF2946 family protein [Polaromonas sp. YR568]|uniref:DUF2946 family protein n=1 Tax=Polaromonas sp. YR568 TaxID=1855301 RepID=UPI00398C0CBE
MRLAAWLAFLAVLSALVAPVAMLAQDVRTGKLGGICSVNTASTASADSGDSDAPQSGLRCDLCASTGLVLPPLPVAAIPCSPSSQLIAIDHPVADSAAIPGLPFSRGPPVL